MEASQEILLTYCPNPSSKGWLRMNFFQSTNGILKVQPIPIGILICRFQGHLFGTKVGDAKRKIHHIHGYMAKHIRFRYEIILLRPLFQALWIAKLHQYHNNKIIIKLGTTNPNSDSPFIFFVLPIAVHPPHAYNRLFTNGGGIRKYGNGPCSLAALPENIEGNMFLPATVTRSGAQWNQPNKTRV
jgi:hypothetical protein